MVEGPFDKRHLDPADVRAREELVTFGWRRLQELAGSGLPLSEYPLPQVRKPLTSGREETPAPAPRDPSP